MHKISNQKYLSKQYWLAVHGKPKTTLILTSLNNNMQLRYSVCIPHYSTENDACPRPIKQSTAVHHLNATEIFVELSSTDTLVEYLVLDLSQCGHHQPGTTDKWTILFQEASDSLQQILTYAEVSKRTRFMSVCLHAIRYILLFDHYIFQHNMAHLFRINTY